MTWLLQCRVTGSRTLDVDLMIRYFMNAGAIGRLLLKCLLAIEINEDEP